MKEDDGVELKYKEDTAHLLTTNKLGIFMEHINPCQVAKSKRKINQLWRSTMLDDPAEQGQVDDYDGRIKDLSMLNPVPGVITVL
ncbi:hypothetical protein Clacol_006053 [Clathrus columnatus]|uniref:Uncharacterized protein n=1 Tax=Clathrus columnatus TaxID=1419009 RepID=A0AAV5AIN9_9AGAM|nr:hypothetical protein Clacol_006053 [Clathrus columnatus]